MSTFTASRRPLPDAASTACATDACATDACATDACATDALRCFPPAAPPWPTARPQFNASSRPTSRIQPTALTHSEEGFSITEAAACPRKPSEILAALADSASPAFGSHAAPAKPYRVRPGLAPPAETGTNGPLVPLPPDPSSPGPLPQNLCSSDPCSLDPCSPDPFEQAGVAPLSHCQWIALAPHLPPARSLGRHRSTDLRNVVEAIHYRWQTACAWRNLPPAFPPWPTVYTYFRAWLKCGLLRQLRAVLQPPKPSEVRAKRQAVTETVTAEAAVTEAAVAQVKRKGR